MKKKLFGYLTLAFAIMSIGLVGSCRDYDEDVFRVKQELKDADSDLYDTIISRYNMAFDSIRSRYKVLMDSIDTLADRQERCRINCNTRFDSVFRTLDTIKGRIDTLDMRVDSLKDTLYYRTDSLRKDVDSLYSRTAYILNKIDTIILKMDTLSKRIDTVNLRVDTVNLRVDTLDLRIDTLDLRIDTLKLRIDTVFMSIDTLRRRVDTLYMSIDTIKRRLDTLGWRIDTLKLRIDTLEMRVDTLEHRVDSLFDAEKKRITSLYVQGALNPTFGYFALPGGIKNNILMGYYGKATYSTSFPADDSDNSACVNEAMALTSAELARLGSGFQESIAGGSPIPADTVKLGKLYLTINPNEVELDTTYKFALVNSIGEVSKAVLDSLKPCSDKLQFGYTRAGGSESNGFYEADVYVLPADVESIKPEVTVEADQLKAIAQKLKNRQLDLGGIAGAVFQLFQTKLDAEAVRTTWTDSLGTHNITSYYDVAATAIKPLSYNAMNGLGSGYSFPHINPIGDLSSFVPSFTMPDFGTINIGGASISIADVVLTIPGSINVTYSAMGGVPATVDLTEFKAALQHDLDGFVDATEASIEAQIDAIIASIQAEVNAKLASMSGQMQSSINDMLNDLSNNISSSFNGYISKMNAIINKINALTSRLNGILSNGAGAFLQPLLVYEGADNSMHPMSTDKNYPSTFVGGSGNITLYPTSYSAELLAPAYKKFVAVVNAWANDDASKATVQSAIDAANSEDFKTVFDGSQYGINFAGQAGYTYEIYYSGIDYDGYISAQRFYVTVK